EDSIGFNEALKGVRNTADELGDSVLRMATGFLSLEGAKELLGKLNEELAKTREELAQFHEGAAKVESLPEYIKNIGGFKNKALDLSEGFGVDVNKVVNPLLYDITRKLSDATGHTEAERQEAAQQSLSYQELTGESAQDVFKARQKLIESH